MEVKPGYKQTDVGVIPNDWRSMSLDDCAIKVGSGVTPTGGSSRYKEYGRPFVRSQNVGWGTLRLEDLAYIDDDTHGSFASSELRTGDVLLNITGASIGRSAVADARLAGGNVNQHVCIIRTDPDNVSSRLIKYLLLSSLGQRQIDSFQAGGNREGLNFGQIRSIKIPLPPTKTEQEAIAEALSDADALIESLEQLLAKNRNVKQGAMQELLTGTKRLPGFSGEWRTRSLGDCGEVTMGQSPPSSSYNRRGVGSPLINGPTEFTDRHPIKVQWTEQPGRFCKTGDLLICVRGSSTGRTNYADDAYAIGRGVAAIRAKDHNDTEYLSYQVVSGVSDILAAATGSTFPSVDGTSLRKLAISLPSPGEQRAIATALSDMDVEIATLEDRLVKARDIKQGMMQELLTGRIRLL